MNERFEERRIRQRREARVSLIEMMEEAYGAVAENLREREVAFYFDHLSSTARELWVDRDAYLERITLLLEKSTEGLERGGVLVYLETSFAPGCDTGELTVLVEAFSGAMEEEVRLITPERMGLGRERGGEPLNAVGWERLVERFESLGGEVYECGHASRLVCVVASLPVARYGLEELPRPLLHGSIQRKRFQVFSHNPFMRAVVSEQLEKFGMKRVQGGSGEADLVVWSGRSDRGGEAEAEAARLLEGAGRPAGLLLGNAAYDTHPLPGCGAVARLVDPLFKYQLLGAVNALLIRRSGD